MNMKLKTRFVQAYFVPLGQWNELCLSEVFNYVAGSEFFCERLQKQSRFVPFT